MDQLLYLPCRPVHTSKSSWKQFDAWENSIPPRRRVEGALPEYRVRRSTDRPDTKEQEESRSRWRGQPGVLNLGGQPRVRSLKACVCYCKRS